MLETQVEKRLSVLVKKQGGKCVKFVSPGNAGVGDRLLLLPGARVFFVELKAPGKTMSSIQRKWAKDLEKLGFRSYCLDTVEKVEDFVAKELLS